MSAIIGRHESSKCALSRCDDFPALHTDIHEWMNDFIDDIASEADFGDFLNKAAFWDLAGRNFFHNERA